MTNSVFEAVDKAPFSGKFIVRDTVRAYVEATPEKEKLHYLRVNALLGGMAIAHAYQAYLGYSVLATNVEHYRDYGNPLDLAAAGLDGVYSVVNAVVAARQAALIPRMNRVRILKKSRPIESVSTASQDDLDDDNSKEEYKAPESKKEKNRLTKHDKAVAAAIGVTLTGQALFGVTAVAANVENSRTVDSTQTNYSHSTPINENYIDSHQTTITLNVDSH